jgi:hypothetical protein
MSTRTSSAERGRLSEELARKAFEGLMERKLRGNTPRIVDVIQPEQNSEMDQHSIDLLLKFHSVKERTVQVKSSEWGRRRYLFKCAQLGIEPLPVIVINWKDSLRYAMSKALRILRLMFRPLHRNARKIVRDAKEEFDTLWEKKLENKWWRRRNRRAPYRVRMAHAF